MLYTNNLCLVVCEVYKSLHQLNPPIMWNTFQLKETPYSLRKCQSLIVPIAKITQTLNSFDFRANLAWNHLDKDMKFKPDVTMFKSTLKAVNINCKCMRCY